jgi:hypothetical protein
MGRYRQRSRWGMGEVGPAKKLVLTQPYIVVMRRNGPVRDGDGIENGESRHTEVRISEAVGKPWFVNIDESTFRGTYPRMIWVPVDANGCPLVTDRLNRGQLL